MGTFTQCNLPEKCMKLILSQKEIAELSDDSTDLYKRNMVDRYIDRPNLVNLMFCRIFKTLPISA